MKNKGPYLTIGKSLSVGEYLVSPNERFYLILQPDGNLCTYKGSGPDPKLKQECLWSSGQTAPGGEFCAFLQNYGNFCVYQGTPSTLGKMLWQTRKGGSGNQFFAIQQSDGNFCVYEGAKPDVDVDQKCIWASNKGGKVGAITVISGADSRFAPLSYNASPRSEITFQAGGNSEIEFYAWRFKDDGSVEHAFTSGDGPYKAPSASAPEPACYKLRDDIQNVHVILSLSPPPAKKGGGVGGPMNGTINVSGGSGR